MDVVDHQSVVIEFADGCTAILNMIGGSAKPSRSIHLVGTEGEIQGNLEDSTFALRDIDLRPGCEYSEQIIDVNVQGDMTGAHGGHGGGDMRLVEDFLKLLNGAPPSISATTIEDSVSGHRIGFLAERARCTGQTVNIEQSNE
jgi:predicted dehydrogenase